MSKRILEGATQSDRAKQRRKLGTLQQLTVQPATRRRYEAAIDDFLRFLQANSLTLPKNRDLLDPIVCDYVEHLWSTGCGRAKASDTLAGLQDFDPKIKHCLPGAWRLLKTWVVNEIPNRAPPLPQHVVHAMCGWAAFRGEFSFAVSLLVGFYGMLRTGEILGLRRTDFSVDGSKRKVLISLGLTKGGKRAGAAESAVIGFDVAVAPLVRWISVASSTKCLTPGPARWRSLFNQALEALKITSFQFRPYSLRRGGATWWFTRHHSLDKILLQGRWQAAKTARIYLNEGLAVLAEMQLPQNDPRLMPYLKQFRHHLSHPTFATLEPPTRVGRAGGRGKGSKAKKKFSKKSCGISRIPASIGGRGLARLTMKWILV